MHFQPLTLTTAREAQVSMLGICEAVAGSTNRASGVELAKLFLKPCNCVLSIGEIYQVGLRPNFHPMEERVLTLSSFARRKAGMPAYQNPPCSFIAISQKIKTTTVGRIHILCEERKVNC